MFRKTDTVIYRSITDAIGCYFISCVAVYVSTRQKIMNVRENTALKFDRDTDDLTGLPNRRSFNVAFENYVKGRSGKILSGCIMMDIDDFKMYNDLYGHIEGDNCLIKIGDCLQLISKKYNIMIARYGGEEFCGIITFINLEDIQKIAQDILTSIEELKIPFASKACKRKYVTLSIGVATSNFDDTAMDVLNKADQALYKSKANGKDCITTL
ncbi:MAG: GGDEF domain-containing protein [Bacilli bacterium]